MPNAYRSHSRRRHRRGRTAEAVKVLRAVGDVFGRAVRSRDAAVERRLLPGHRRHDSAERLRDAARRVRRHLHRRARRSARARQPPRPRHSARHPLRARPLRQLPSGAAASRAAVPAEGPTPADVELRRLPREHRGLYVGIGGRFKAGTDDEVAIQEEVNTYKGVHRIVRHAFEYARANGRTKRLHGRQEQRDDAGPRAVAARVPRGPRRSIRTSRRGTSTSTRSRC